VLAVEFAPQGAALNQLKHGLGGRGTTWFVTFGRGQTVQADRHASDLDRVAVPHVRDLAGKDPRGHMPALAGKPASKAASPSNGIQSQLRPTLVP
jgi:hypothetical protein